MSVEMTPSDVPDRALSRPITEIARDTIVDPRIPALVPGFDAPFFQAGLAGYSDGAMRLVARRHGCPYCVTEALLDQTLINGGKGRTREDPDILAEECGTGEVEENRAAGLDDHPIAGQIMGTYPDQMAHGAQILASMGYETIDVNLACPVKKIRKRSRGGHFLSTPDEAIDILRAVRDALPSEQKTTLKIRRAYDDTPEMAHNFERIFNAAYELGYIWATVHCRTVRQKYLGPGRWAFLTDLTARYSDRIIFGSGDIWTVNDIFAMLDVTNVQAVSVARGCIGNPWIFRQARQLMAGEQPTPPTLDEQRCALLEHFELSMALHGESAASRMMRKFGIKFSTHHPTPDRVKNEFIRCRSVDDWRSVLDRYYTNASISPESAIPHTTSTAP
ncbi:MAG: tRNA-dihydrouridine synthase [Planctomycetota bacterium]